MRNLVQLGPVSVDILGQSWRRQRTKTHLAKYPESPDLLWISESRFDALGHEVVVDTLRQAPALVCGTNPKKEQNTSRTSVRGFVDATDIVPFPEGGSTGQRRSDPNADDPETGDTGCGIHISAVVDMGAYEFPGLSAGNSLFLGDVDADRTVGIVDLLAMFAVWSLVQLHMPRPIHDEIELDNATGLVDLMAGHDLSADQVDYLDLLSDLVARYEEAASPIGTGAPPREVLGWLLEEHNMSVTEFGKLLGDRSLGSRVLSGERSLSKRHIRTLAQRFKISAAAFL